MKPLAPLSPPVSASDCADVDGNAGWASRVLFCHAELRAGAGCIEARSQRVPDYWAPIMLPGGGTQFATPEDRDTVLAWATAAQKIPNISTKETP